jgi:hypothetical protein
MSATTYVNFYTEDDRPLASWHVTGRPEVGDQIHKSYLPGDVYVVVAVQWTGNQQARCVCKPVEVPS